MVVGGNGKDGQLDKNLTSSARYDSRHYEARRGEARRGDDCASAAGAALPAIAA